MPSSLAAPPKLDRLGRLCRRAVLRCRALLRRRALVRRPGLRGGRGPLRTGACLGLAAAALAAGSCHLTPLSRFFGGETQLQVSISPLLNHNAPVAVEVVVAYDQSLLNQLQQYTAQQWFDQRQQFLQDHKGQNRPFDSWEWEWVPGQLVGAIPLEYKVGARGGVIFVSYATSGAHRQSLDPQRNIVLALGESDFTVTQP